MPTLFEKFVANPLPEEIYRYTPKPDAAPDDGVIIAFMDNRPATRGHMLIVPAEPEGNWENLSLMRWQQLSALSHIMARWIRTRLPDINRQGLLISGYGVDHAHVHILPSYERGDMIRVFDHERLKMPDDAQLARNQDMLSVAERLSFSSPEALAIDLATQTNELLGGIALLHSIGDLKLPSGLIVPAKS